MWSITTSCTELLCCSDGLRTTSAGPSSHRLYFTSGGVQRPNELTGIGLMTVLLVGYFSMQLPVGYLGDRHGRKMMQVLDPVPSRQPWRPHCSPRSPLHRQRGRWARLRMADGPGTGQVSPLRIRGCVPNGIDFAPEILAEEVTDTKYGERQASGDDLPARCVQKQARTRQNSM